MEMLKYIFSQPQEHTYYNSSTNTGAGEFQYNSWFLPQDKNTIMQKKIIPTDQRKDKVFDNTHFKFPLPNFKESLCHNVGGKIKLFAKKKETIGVSFEFSSMCPVAPFT